MIGGAILDIRSAKLVYGVTMASSSGEANALASKDKASVERVVKSINDAIVKYR